MNLNNLSLNMRHFIVKVIVLLILLLLLKINNKILKLKCKICIMIILLIKFIVRLFEIRLQPIIFQFNLILKHSFMDQFQIIRPFLVKFIEISPKYLFKLITQSNHPFKLGQPFSHILQ